MLRSVQIKNEMANVSRLFQLWLVNFHYLTDEVKRLVVVERSFESDKKHRLTSRSDCKRMRGSRFVVQQQREGGAE